MRKIKFRAWDKKKKVWIDNFQLYSNGKLVGVNHAYGNIILMQYTGLSDKNGVEIYEGDIIKAANYVDAHYLIKWSDNQAGWFPELLDNGRYGCTYGTVDKEFISRNEVIGNIYENPELQGDTNE